MATDQTNDGEWLPILGRSLGLLVLHAENLRDAPLVDQWLVLERLGYTREDGARMLGTSADSLRVLANRKRAKDASAKTK